MVLSWMPVGGSEYVPTRTLLLRDCCTKLLVGARAFLFDPNHLDVSPGPKPGRRDLPAAEWLFMVLFMVFSWASSAFFSYEHVPDCLLLLLLHQPGPRRDRRLTAARSVDVPCNNAVVLHLAALLALVFPDLVWSS